MLVFRLSVSGAGSNLAKSIVTRADDMAQAIAAEQCHGWES